MNNNLIYVLKEIEREKGIPEAALLDAIKSALALACRKQLGINAEVHVDFHPSTGDFKVFAEKEVVQQAWDKSSQIDLETARRINPAVELGDKVLIEVTPQNFGRIAAQTAKQVILQRIREAERDALYNELADKEGELVNGEVQRSEGRYVFVDVGRVEAVLPPNEQAANERYRPGDRMKFYVVQVKKTNRGPEMILSRSHPNLIKRLFELESPEVEEGIVEIKAIAREAGLRSKVAVASNDPHVDASGACIGTRGSRVGAVTEELGGEKVDIINWSDSPAEFIREALSPAEVKQVILDEENHLATVIADNSQASLAIGRQGQNVRLAAKLTGWRIDIRSTSEESEQPEESDAEAETPEGADTSETAQVEAGADAEEPVAPENAAEVEKSE